MSELTAIDDLIARFFAAFDNRHGHVPGIAPLLAFFAPDATIVSHAADRIIVCDAQSFAAPRIELLGAGTLVDFHEWEDEAQTEILESLAVRRSRYSKRGTFDGRPYTGRGTKFFQLVRLADGWRIAALSWIDDDAVGARAARKSGTAA